MVIRLIYKALRFISMIIAAFVLMLLLSKLLPFLHDIFLSVISFIKAILNSIKSFISIILV